MVVVVLVMLLLLCDDDDVAGVSTSAVCKACTMRCRADSIAETDRSRSTVSRTAEEEGEDASVLRLPSPASADVSLAEKAEEEEEEGGGLLLLLCMGRFG